MKTDLNTKLVAIEEETLETVAGGFAFAAPSFDLKKFDLDINVLKVEANAAYNDVQAALGSTANLIVSQTVTQQG